MREILMIRHGQAEVNLARGSKPSSPAFGHTKSPLTLRGEGQSKQLAHELEESYGIKPEEFSRPVAASEFLRPQQTAEFAGFKYIHVQPILNELDLSPDLVAGRLAIEKHAAERWTPDVEGRARRFIELVRAGDLEYDIFFSHGLFIASVMLDLESEVGEGESPYIFDRSRGFVPQQAEIVKLSV